jgi:hypothetical protein
MKWKKVLYLVLSFYVFYNAFIVLNDNSSSMVDAQATLTIDATQVDAQRVDVRDQAIFAIRIVRTSDGHPLQFGRVTFQNRPGVWYTDYYGWCIVPVISWDVGNFSLVVDSIYSGATQLSFEWGVPKSWSVFDQVLVDLKTSKPRVGVDTEAPIRWTATYAFDGAPFQGQIILDENLTSSTVENRTYQVAKVNDELYNLTVFESDPLEIIFDRVLVTLDASDERINVGSEAEIEWTATYEYDQTPFHGWVEFNDTLIQDEAGKFRYAVGSVGDAQYDVESFESNAVDVIFDEVTVKIRADDSRLDVGEEVDITLHARYGYNNEPFEGDITLNRDDFVSNVVASKFYFVEDVEDPIYGLTSFSSDELEVIWDRIELEIEAEDERISLGEDAVLRWTGTYGWDGSVFYGEVEFSPDVLALDSVGDIEYEVAGVIDPIYGITAFKSNAVEVVWDRVEVSIEFPHGRTEVGTEPDVVFDSSYEYDGRTFSGTVHLNDTLVKDGLGRHGFTASSVEDPRFGITDFVSNEASCVWDRIEVERSISSIIPGTVQVSLKLVYASDGRPVENAYIVVNGKPCVETEAGTYVKGLTNLLPILPINVQVDGTGIEEEYAFGIQFSLGNVGLYGALIAAIVVLYTKGLLKKP